MARNKRPKSGDRVSDFMNSLKLKDLKRACIMRGIPFPRVSRYDVHGLQSWLYKNYTNRINVVLLEDYDAWFDGEIESGPVPLSLRMAFYGQDDDGNVKKERRNTLLMGVAKTKTEIASFQPKRGSKKELVFALVREGKGTKEVITQVMEAFEDANEGSIKSWCSKARRAVKAQEELDEA